MSNNLPMGPGEGHHALGPLEEQIPVDHQVMHPPTQGLGGDTAEGQGGIRRHLESLWRYRLWISLIALIGTGIGAWVGSYYPSVYEAQSTIWIEEPEQGTGAPGPIRSAQLLHTTGWIDLLSSFTVLDHVVADLRLYLRLAAPGDSLLFTDFELKDKFRPGRYTLTVDEIGKRLTLYDRGGEPLQEGLVGDSVGQDQGFSWVPPPHLLWPGAEVRFTVENPRDIAHQLGARITPDMPTGQFLRISLAGSHPARITATVNAIAERYVQVAAELKSAKLNEEAAILYEQLQRAEESLREADNELESFRIATITMPTEKAIPVAAGLQQTHDPVFANFFEMKFEQDQLRRDREAIERALERAESEPISVVSLEYISSVQTASELVEALRRLTMRRAELRAVRIQYTDDHPEVRLQADEIRSLERITIPYLAHELIREMESRDAQIEENIRLASEELQQVPIRQLEEARLTRQMRMAEELYSNLLTRFETARLAAVSSIPDVRILEKAIAPQRPVKEMSLRVIAMAFVGSLGIAVFGALLRSRFDPKVRYPDQVTSGLRLNILGAIPVLKGSRRADGGDPTAQVIEAFRELRLSLSHAHGTAGPLVTVVTSSGSGDGKSFVSSNLCLTFADHGYHSLLIDADLRRGTQARRLDLPGKPGLAEYLSGEAKLEKVIRKTPYSNLHLIPCGTRSAGGVELLGSKEMSNLLLELRSQYQVIIIDSPPLGAGVDAYLLSALVGEMLLVVRADYTDREFTEAKLSLIDRLPVRILGAVLNAVPPRGAYRYYTYLPDYEEAGTGLVLAEGRE